MPATPLRSDELFPYRSIRQILANRKPVVHSVGSDDTVASALELMSRHNIGLVVVLDGEELIGVLSERDLARRAGQHGALALQGLPVAALMTRNVTTVGPDELFGRCLALMDERGARHLPVVDAGRVIAVISVRDLLHEAVEHHRQVLAEMDRERLAAFQTMH